MLKEVSGLPFRHPRSAGLGWNITLATSRPSVREAAYVIREVIDRIVVTPGPKRGAAHFTLQGELGTILNWIERAAKSGTKIKLDSTSSRLSVSVKARA